MEEKKDSSKADRKKTFNINSTFHQTDDDDDGEILKTEPIADHFPNTTVLFADIVGFTAWSSTRVNHLVV